jgi:hypothetical protein
MSIVLFDDVCRAIKTKDSKVEEKLIKDIQLFGLEVKGSKE